MSTWTFVAETGQQQAHKDDTESKKHRGRPSKSAKRKNTDGGASPPNKRCRLADTDIMFTPYEPVGSMILLKWILKRQ